MEQDSLSSRLERMEDYLKIQALSSRYCWFVDEGIEKKDETSINKLFELFSDQPEVDFGPFGKYAGRKDISNFFKDYVYKNFDSFSHNVMNFDVNIDGKTADAKFYSILFGIMDGKSVMSSGKYYTACEKNGENWKFKTLRCEFYIFNYVEAAWGQKKTFF